MALQKVTKTISTFSDEVTDYRHQILIDYRALNGLLTDDDGLHKMTVDELAQQLEVTRKTLYEWQKKIPHFWQKVNARRGELAPQSRLARMHEVWYLAALNPKNFQDRQLWLANFDENFRMPTEKVEHNFGSGLADLAIAAQREQAQERKVIDVEPADQSPTGA